ncbi:ImmA/IrrE family metallo-endopeptidase [Limosilactobacillus fermentum]
MPDLEDSGVIGAVKWLGKDKVVLALNARLKEVDQFWFALFHELKHVLQKQTSHIILTTEPQFAVTSKLKMAKLEEEADEFAKNYLIDAKDYSSFVAKGAFSVATVTAFAEQLGIHPGIVVGRLQKEGLISNGELTQLRTEYMDLVTLSSK